MVMDVSGIDYVQGVIVQVLIANYRDTVATRLLMKRLPTLKEN